jgi:hypothetical protein
LLALKKTSTPAKDDPPPEQDTSAPDVHMDMGAQQDTLDTGANASGVETGEDADAGDKSAGIDKGKNPEVPKVRTDLASASPGQATPAAPENPAPKTPAPEKTTAAPAKTGTFKMTRIIKTAAAPAKTAPVSVKLAPTTGKTAAASSAMMLHTGKGAARVSSFHTPELEGRVSLRTKSDNSLGSLKEYRMKWNDADFVDTASSGKKKALAGTPAPGNPDVILAKPIAIGSELFSIQQRLYRLADATNVSTFPHISPVPKNVGCLGYRHLGFSNISFNLADFSNCPTYKLDPSFKS